MAAAAALLAGCGGDADSGETTVDRAGDLESLESDGERLEKRIKKLERKAAQAGTGGSPPGGRGSTGERLPGAAGLEARLGAQVGVALGPVGRAEVRAGGSITSGPAWSTIKVPIALRVLADAGGPRGLASRTSDQIEAALTRSDNAAAAELFVQVAAEHGGPGAAAGAVGEILREAGDRTTEISTIGRDGFSTYGQTDWPLKAQQRFMAALARGEIGSPASRALVLDLMGSVYPDTWGLGSLGVPARWKGGWGPDPDGGYLVRQMGLIEIGGEEYAIAIAARPGDGSFESGQTAASAAAAWAAESLR